MVHRTGLWCAALGSAEVLGLGILLQTGPTLIHVAVGVLAGALAVPQVRRPLALVTVPIGEDAAARALPPARLPGARVFVAVRAAALSCRVHIRS